MAKKKRNSNQNNKDRDYTITKTVETDTTTTYTPSASRKNVKTTKNGGRSAKSRNGNRHNELNSRVKKDTVQNNAASLVGKENDPSWYNSNGQLVTDAASISFYTPAGAPYFPAWNASGKGAAVPGIMTLDVVPIPGLSTERASALNLAALKLYTGMRKANSGAVNYSHADLMMYCLAMDSVYIMYSEALRLYGILNCWSQYNRYKPQDIVRALGYDYTDFRENMADFRAWLNIWIKRANSFSLPVSFTISKRHSWLFSNIWSDSSSAKAQLYAYRPAVVYEWDDQSNPEGSQLVAKTWNNKGVWVQPKTFTAMRDFMDELLDSIANSDDIAIMGGDLEKAFGTQNMFSMASIDENYEVNPVFSEEVLMQIENSMFLPGATDWVGTDTNLNITQNVDANRIECNPSIYIDHSNVGDATNLLSYTYQFYDLLGSTSAHIGLPVNMHFDNPSPDDVMVATRNKFILDVNHAEAGSVVTFKSVGSEFISDVAIWTRLTHGSDSNFSRWNPVLEGMNLYPYVPKYTEVKALSDADANRALSSAIFTDLFDWHPAVFAVLCPYAAGVSSPILPDIISISMDLDNYTEIYSDTLKKIHDAAVYNMWDLNL